MIIGVDSRIGFSFIVGPSLLQNTLHVFQAGGMMSPQAGPVEAIQCARNFAVQLRKLGSVPEQITRRFPTIHEQLGDQLGAEFPPSLHQAFEEFQRSPTIAGAALYFDLLADLLNEAVNPASRRPKPSH